MPIYEYQCGDCGHTLEALQKITEDALTQCPVCHKESLQKLISATSFQLKGTGWYATDFKNKGNSESKNTKTTDGSSNTTGGDAKPAESTPATSSTTSTDTKSN